MKLHLMKFLSTMSFTVDCLWSLAPVTNLALLAPVLGCLLAEMALLGILIVLDSEFISVRFRISEAKIWTNNKHPKMVKMGGSFEKDIYFV